MPHDLSARDVSMSRRKLLGMAAAGTAAISAGGLLAACGSSNAPSTGSAEAGPPRSGGTVTAGMVGGSATDSLDPHGGFTDIDVVRAFALYAPLIRTQPIGQKNDYILAEEITPSPDLRSWTIRLKPDLRFSNGAPITAQDVIYTFRRITDPAHPLNGATQLTPLNTADATVLDPRTVRFGTHAPFGGFIDQISKGTTFQIVPDGFDVRNPVSSGPFKFKSFTPGRESVFVRNEHYYRPDRPYLDELRIIDLSDPQAGYNAVLTGQIDAYGSALPSFADQAKASPDLKLLISEPAQWIPFTMRYDTAPFRDARVRQAFRFLADRPQLVEQAFSGYGVVGNDLYGWSDDGFPSDWERHQDIDQAKWLLNQAGYADTPIDLVTSDFAPGATALAQTFAQQADAAGVKINVQKVNSGTYQNGYGDWTFSQDFWGNQSYLGVAPLAFLPNGPFNDSHYDNPRYAELLKETNSTIDPARIAELKREMWTIDFKEGTWIIPVYGKIIDILSARVQGLPKSEWGYAFGSARWEDAWLSN